MIEFIKSESAQIDVMGGASRIQSNIGNHGFVALVDIMPRLVPEGMSADYAIAQAARISYGAGTKTVSDDENLIRYLRRHNHTTPSEMVEFKFHLALPLFICRQLVRHRAASINEYSARYSIIKDRFYRPDRNDVAAQSKANKQGRDEPLDEMTTNDFFEYLDDSEKLYKKYEHLVDEGVSREIARIGLPVSIFTELYWKIDLHNLSHFLALRMDHHAQKEIRDYANAMYEIVSLMCPIAIKAFDDYHPLRNGMLLTSLEVDAINNGSYILNTSNKREINEWNTKKQRLGIHV